MEPNYMGELPVCMQKPNSDHNQQRQQNPMTIFFAVSAECLVEILSGWCTLKDVAKVDSAFCNNLDRIDILVIFLHIGFVMQDEVQYQPYCVEYLNLRKIKVRSIQFRNIDHKSPFSKLEMMNCSKIESLSFIHCMEPVEPNTEQITSFISKCTELRFIRISSWGRKAASGSYVHFVRPHVLSNLTSFSGDGISVTNEAITYLSKYCSLLVFLELDFLKIEPFPLLSLIKLLKLNKNLIDLRIEHISGTGDVKEIVNCIAANCKMLRKLLFVKCSDIEVPCVTNLLKQCDEVMHVQLLGSGRNNLVDFDRNKKKATLLCSDKSWPDDDVIELLQMFPDCTSIELSLLTKRVLTFICSAYFHSLASFTAPLCASDVVAEDVVVMLQSCRKLTNFGLSSSAGANFLDKLAVCIAEWNNHCKESHNGETLKLVM